MLLSQHAIVGSVIAVGTGNPVVGFAGGFISHHILDMTPHIDGPLYHYKKPDGTPWPISIWIISIVDVLFTMLLLTFITFRSESIFLLLIGSLGGSLPDIVTNVPLWKYRIRKIKLLDHYQKIHGKFHWRWKDAKFLSLAMTALWQILITIGGVWILLKGF